MQPTTHNPEFQLAEQLALYTHKHLFLTGKAGSGKTTLLKKIAAQTKKNFVVVAPTGVAAINAGGVTIHSQFNLPLTSFIPSSDSVDPNLITNRRALLNHLKFRRDKLKVIQEMELLIIDEVSMVRADILDAVDFVMRSLRRNNHPFGGAQVMLIGDMHQLPPVVKDNEWQLLKQYYTSPYFFDSVVWSQLDAAEVELKKIYRQSDERFLQLLNNIRHHQLEEDDYEILNELYQPDFEPTEEGYILLTTHNRKADSVNNAALLDLPGRLHVFEAAISGDFPEHLYPCDRVLELKVGAQVMFTRNDAEGGQYFNGKLAVVKHLEGNHITVTFQDSGRDFLLKKEVWENVSYSVDENNDTIKPKVNGSFTQYPLRLAWAITIHKSQGLTFDKVIIDAGNSFAAGQVYVALSRCRTLQGIVLHSLITQSALHSDEKITAFSEEHHGEQELQGILEQAKREYAFMQLQRLFDFNKLRYKVADWKELLLEKDLPQKEEALALFEKINSSIEALITTSQRFHPQLESLLVDYSNHPRHLTVLQERCDKAIAYFTETIFKTLIEPLHAHIEAMAFKSKVKRYVQQVQMVQDNFWNKMQQLYGASFMEHRLYAGEVKHRKEAMQQTQSAVTTTKKEKGGTFHDTLTLYRQGKTAEEIAAIRGLTVGTIKTHFAKWILSGDVQIEKVLPAETIRTLSEFLSKQSPVSVSGALRHFGNRYDGNDIRMVLSELQRKRGRA